MISVKLGDEVTRWLGGRNGVRLRLRVTEIENGVITCDLWTFDQATGAEIDEDLGWGPPPLTTGSFIEEIKP